MVTTNCSKKPEKILDFFFSDLFESKKPKTKTRDKTRREKKQRKDTKIKLNLSTLKNNR